MKRLANLFQLAVLAGFNIYCLRLYWSGDLVAYIHPRYVAFAGIMNAVSLIICSLAVVWVFKHSHSEPVQGKRWLAAVLTIPMVVVLALGWALPVQSLDRADVASKSLLELTKNADGQRLSFATAQPEGEQSIAAWMNYLSGPVFEEEVVRHPVDIMGFVQAGVSYQENEFVLSRLVIYCCAVDATPVGLSVHEQAWRSHLSDGQWIRIKGSFKNFGTSGIANYILVPSSIENIDKPAAPYIYHVPPQDAQYDSPMSTPVNY